MTLGLPKHTRNCFGHKAAVMTLANLQREQCVPNEARSSCQTAQFQIPRTFCPILYLQVLLVLKTPCGVSPHAPVVANCAWRFMPSVRLIDLVWSCLISADLVRILFDFSFGKVAKENCPRWVSKYRRFGQIGHPIFDHAKIHSQTVTKIQKIVN